MEYRTLGGSGLKIPALILGTATFGGGSEFLRKWGAADVQEAGLSRWASKVRFRAQGGAA